MTTTKEQKQKALNDWHLLRKGRQDLVMDYEGKLLDAIESRNNSKPESKQEQEALATIEHIESSCSGLMFGFGNKSHSWTECSEEVALQQTKWKTKSPFFLALIGRRSRSVEEGTEVFRHKGKWVVLQHVQHAGRAAIETLSVPEHMVTVAE